MKTSATVVVLGLAALLIAFALSAYGFYMPEPGNVALLALGFVGLKLARRRVRAGTDSTVKD